MIVLGFGSLGSCKKRYGSSIFCGSLPTDQLGDDAWPITDPTLGVYGNREILHTDATLRFTCRVAKRSFGLICSFRYFTGP